MKQTTKAMAQGGSTGRTQGFERGTKKGDLGEADSIASRGAESRSKGPRGRKEPLLHLLLEDLETSSRPGSIPTKDDRNR